MCLCKKDIHIQNCINLNHYLPLTVVMRSRKRDIPADDECERCDERGSVEERAKQNTGHVLEVQTKDL